MAILAFVIIAHEKAERVCRTIDALLQVDRDCLVALHYDRNSPSREFSIPTTRTWPTLCNPGQRRAGQALIAYRG